MSGVVNSSAFLTRFATLGWTTSTADLLQAIGSSGIPAVVIAAYLDALIATPTGLNDQTIAGVTAVQGSAITNFLKSKGLVEV